MSADAGAPPAADGQGRWAAGHGVIRHTPLTRRRVTTMLAALGARGERGQGPPAWEILGAADRLASAGMWLVVHETYASRVYLDGRPLAAADFKPAPEGHTGGSLNMVPAYTGYLAINALTGVTRAWLMGQGHCVAAVDSVNLLVGNTTAAHAERYDLSEAGLTRYVRDFYSYRLDARGRQDSPLGSHVNAHTAGGVSEGGYLGFAELQYVHVPLPGERLVAFLSDGAFEEQRGSDWAPRWWRASDSGLVAPIMIANGRRIDQRTTMSQQGGVAWFTRHLRLNGFDPIVFDGRDPAAFAWAIWEIERRLEAAAHAVGEGRQRYPVPLPYGIAVAPKGAGFHGAGTNLAHNLPLGANPHSDRTAARHFNHAARRLWVPADALRTAAEALQQHARASRPRERDTPPANRQVALAREPGPAWRPVPADRRERAAWSTASPMAAIDDGFLATVQANPQLRPRVGNPDEMRSNRMQRTLDALKFRVTAPEPGIPEAVDGAVVTALNEEAVACAALANKGGINIAVTYEAFGAKMHGAVRQEIVFADHLGRAGRPPGWLSIPLVLTSHAWENAKNEQSHQDPAMAEAMLAEPSHVSRVVFPLDSNTTAAAIREVYRTHGQIWTLVVPKGSSIPDLFTGDEAEALVRDGAAVLPWAGFRPEHARVVLTAVGAYQLVQALRASERLAVREVAHAVVAMLEPGRFRRPRDERERAHAAAAEVVQACYPDAVRARVFLTHTRPESVLGALGPLHTGPDTVGLGFINQGGTLSIEGLLFVNRATWAHAVEAAARLLGLPREQVLDEPERAALDGRASPEGVIVSPAAP
ncbi:MAG TPA: xylulose 5-phosphate 3-epimerase [Methylomirabilota bacterium]|nr:xylulose 5-phosphate 3-epimerase [Methylomirabilota bacterium]